MKEKIYQGILRLFLWLHGESERYFFYFLPKLFGRNHPKNDFDFRTRDFIDRISNRDVVADLGCGTGKLAKKIAALGCKVFAVDRRIPNEANCGPVLFLQQDLLSPGLPQLLENHGIDVIILSHILEHLPNPVEFLAQLKVSSKILICVPSEENWRYQLKKALGLDPRTDPEHYREYTKDSLRLEIEGAGWKVKEIFYNAQGELFATAVLS